MQNQDGVGSVEEKGVLDEALEVLGVGRPATPRQVQALRRGWSNLSGVERGAMLRVLGVEAVVLPGAQAVVLVRNVGDARLRPVSFNQAHVLIDYLMERGDGRARESGQP